ncbi:MAG: DNA methyltransferase [bacterium]
MRTLRHAAERLAAGNTESGRLAIATALGFDPIALPVDADSARRLGLPADIAHAQIVRGRGALRALLLDAPNEPSLRALLTRVAAALSSRTSHVLWLVIGFAADSDDVGVACWSPTARGPRVFALVAKRTRVVASDAETLCALAATSEGDDLLVFTRWCDLLGREALSRRFYRILEQRVRALGDSLLGVNATDRAELALLYVSRLLFLSFLETKGWLNRDHAFLAHHFDECMAAGGGFHRRVLLPLFFGTLNTPFRHRAAVARTFGSIPFLNGGLFTKSALERAHANARFSDAAFGALFGELLGAYRFTAREGQEQWSETAIDPEMLGRAFESLMVARDRRVSGAFYTPQPLVTHVSDRALIVALSDDTLAQDDIRAALRGELLAPATAERLREKLRGFTLLDPACGSGAFLVHVLERLADLHRAAGDTRTLAAIRRDVLARAIHGVDVNPTAVWLCELRLWLSVVIESGETRMSAVPPLPNLDCNVRVGDTLSGEGFIEPPSLVGPSAALVRLRDRYVRAAGPRKAPLRRALAREERRRAIAVIDRQLVALADQRRERLLARRSADLFGERTRPGADERAEMRAQRLRAAALRRDRRRIVNDGALPFSFPSHFGAAHSRGGFDLIIGNPPWVRLHNIPSEARSALRTRFVVYRDAAWEAGARSGHAGRGFSAQVDVAALFAERSLELARPDGCIALLLPAKLWRSLSGGGVRRLLSEGAQLRAVEDWSDAPSSFDAAVYPSVMIAARNGAKKALLPSRHEMVVVGVKRRSIEVEWQDAPVSIRLVRDDAASPWLLLPPDVRASFDRIASHGIPLGESAMGRATLGVKCGCNDAFMVDALDEATGGINVEHRGRHGVIERSLLRPLLRGDSVAAWSIPSSRSAIVWTHANPGGPLATLPAGAAKWLAPWRRQLTGRSDLRGSAAWWTLFRTEGADHSRTRVVWSDFGRVPRAAILPVGDQTVPLNSCYVVSCDDVRDALALTALLNGPLAAAWLNAIAEPARGGWHRYLAWTVSLLPLPRDWLRARELLAPLTECALVGKPPSSAELLAAACRAYRVREADVAPLIAWCHAPTTG